MEGSGWTHGAPARGSGPGHRAGIGSGFPHPLFREMRSWASRLPGRALLPFFAAYLGWLGVFLTGSDTASNALFGSLQRITAQQLHLNEVLIVATNSTGGVMGKMIDAQSIMVACAACYDDPYDELTRWARSSHSPWHSVAGAGVIGLIAFLQAYVFTGMIPQ